MTAVAGTMPRVNRYRVGDEQISSGKATLTDLVDLLLVSGSVEFLGDHKSRVVGLQKALLIGPRVQVAQTFVHAVDAHLGNSKGH